MIEYFEEPTKIRFWDTDDTWNTGIGYGEYIIDDNSNLRISLKDYYEEVRIAHVWHEGPGAYKAIEIID